MRPMRWDATPPAGHLVRVWRRLRRWRYQETDTRRYDRDQGCLVQRGLWRVGDAYYAYDYDDVAGVRRAVDVPGGLLREVDPLSGNFVRGGRILAGGYVIAGDGRSLRSEMDIIKAEAGIDLHAVEAGIDLHAVEG